MNRNSVLPYLPELAQNEPEPPGVEDCLSLWRKYEMPENIRRHSFSVAQIATALARRAQTQGFSISWQAARAAGLLHDIAKAYCIRYGGGHAMLGCAWTVRETGNLAISQAVLLHVRWPWSLPRGKALCSLPIFIIYADKRVRHDSIVTLPERFADLLARYGKTRRARSGIRSTLKQARYMERALSKLLQWNLADEHTFAGGRLVN